MTSDPLFGAMFSTPALEVVASARGRVQAMLDVEAALARARVSLGLIPAEAAEAIAAACRVELYSLDDIAAGAARDATPVVALVAMIRRQVGDAYADHVHTGATSQDIVDSAMMLTAQRAIGAIVPGIDRAAARLAALAREHRRTLVPGRTLLQPALPITFGLKCALWLDGLLDGRMRLQEVREQRLAVQLGGAAGTLASFGDTGPALVQALAAELGLCAPALPWHTNRARVVELASALSMIAGAAGKVAGDLVLLSQPEIGEVTFGAAAAGRSSAMPHKRNPAAAVLAIAAARQAMAYAGTIHGLQMHEHERAAGAWQAEWQPLNLLMQATGAAVHHLASALDALEPRPGTMLRNLDAARGLPMAEALVTALSPLCSPERARALVEAACDRVLANGSSLLEEALADGAVAGHLDEPTLRELLDPSRYLGSAGVFVERALARYESTCRPGADT